MPFMLDGINQTPVPESAITTAEGDSLLTRPQAWSLYLLHFLFTWNARTYEFAAIVFTASVYPNTLTAASIRGITTTVSSIIFASAIGRWIDHASSRLRTLTSTINVHRLVILAAYLVWMLLASFNASQNRQVDVLEIPKAIDGGNIHTSGIWKNSLFAMILVLGVFERLSDVANGLTLDRDWLPVLVPSSATLTSRDSGYDLTHLNAVMRRIDLICKLLTPFTISIFVSKANHYLVGIVVLVLLSSVSWVVEIRLAYWIYSTSPMLSTPKDLPSLDALITNTKEERNPTSLIWPWLTRIYFQGQAIISNQATSLHQYFSSNVWQPSMAWALLHLTVLAYSASLITYLLSTGLSLQLVTVARASGSAIEVSSTIITPYIIHLLSRSTRTPSADEHDTESLLDEESKSKPRDHSVLKKVGLGGISWQFTCLIPVVISLFYLSPSTLSPSLLPILLLFIPLSLSRLGYWTYDLTTQELTQTLVPASQRSSFAGTERSFQAFFQLCHWVATAIWGHPDMFPWLALGSLSAVGAAGGLYGWWLWSQRGRKQKRAG